MMEKSTHSLGSSNSTRSTRRSPFIRRMLPLFRFMRRHATLLTGVSLTLLGFFIVIALRTLLIALIFALVLVVLHALLSSYKKLSIPLEFELITFGAVVLALRISSLAALLFSLGAFFLEGVVRQSFKDYEFVRFGSCFIVSFVPPLISSLPIFVLGLVVTALKNLFELVGYHLIGAPPVKNMLKRLSNIAWNYIMFSSLAALAMRILG